MNAALSWSSTPLWLALLWLVAEGVCRVRRRRRRAAMPPTAVERAEGSGWETLLLWGLRPWGVWALFSLVWRSQAAFAYDHDLTTFPFYAHLWQPGVSIASRLVTLGGRSQVWLWAGLALASLAALTALARAIAGGGRLARGGVAWRLAAVYLLGGVLLLTAACLPDGPQSRPDGRPGSLTRSWTAHGTVLYAIPRIKSPSHFMRHFAAIQPRLRITIHALTHPPGGALSLYWLGRLAGVPRGADIRSEAVRLRYLFALAGFGLLNALAVYALAHGLFGERKVALLAALLWVVAPTTLIHGTFAQDTVYVVFYTLALWLGWRVAATGERPPVGAALLLGTLFAALTMLNFSWCLMTAIFALFCLQVGVRRAWSCRELALRALLPLTVMTLLAGAILLRYRLDYWEIYRVASDYVKHWYRFVGPYQWLMALFGGQFDLWLMMGGVTLSAFLFAERQAARDGDAPWARRYLLTTLGILLLPLLFGPHPLKMETARCWNWMLPIPMAFAARGLLRHPAAGLLAPGAVAVSGLTFLALRLFMNFSP
jgi:hypothetical protein